MRITTIIRLCLLFSEVLLLTLGPLLPGVEVPIAAAYAPPNVDQAIPNASFHLWEINEIFSCPDGSAQFVEMTTNVTGQEFLDGHILRATSGAQTHSFTFPNDAPNYTTTPKSLLIATAGFGSLSGGVAPDYILPPNFIFITGSGSVQLVGAATTPISYSSGGLPLDGVTSLGQGGATGVNSPRNFAGTQGSISCPPAPDLTLSKTADAVGIVQTGSTLTYTLVAANKGTAAATNGLIRDTIPVSTTYISNSASNGGTFAGGVVSWAGLTIAPGATLTRTFQVTVSAIITIGDKITNTAQITSTEGEIASAAVAVTGGSQTGNKTYLPVIFKRG